MKLAIECPIPMLEMVQPFADFDWVLAKEVMDDEKYAEFYLQSEKPGFLDNSVNEEGEPMSVKEMKKVYDALKKPLMVVAPDWLGKMDETILAYKEAVEVFGKNNVVGVLQGETPEEALSCLNHYGHQIAVPYDICNDRTTSPEVMATTRALIVSNLPSEVYIHLLGFVSLSEFFWYQNKPNVVSIDTGAPVLLGLMGLDILDPLETKETPTYKLMEKLELTPNAWTTICRNIALFRRFLP